MMKNKDFCVFILTHGRANNIVTLKSLKKANYTGPIYFIIDNEDTQINEYYKLYGKDNVIVFNKLNESKKVDEGDNFNDRRATIYARNISFSIAKKLNYKYFIQLDDDYTSFDYRYNNNFNYKYHTIKNLDNIFDICINYLKNTKNITSFAMSQGGDFIGGKNNGFFYPKRKCMNTWFCNIERPFNFMARMNDDITTSIVLGSKGKVFFTTPYLSITQAATQKLKGGMSDIYLNNGTYVKSFYSVMYMPACVKVAILNSKHKRLHHSISWNNAVPVIISDNYKKK